MKERNIYLTIFLYLTIVSLLITAYYYQKLIFNEHPLFIFAPTRTIILFIGCILNIVCHILILNWNKFGFFGALILTLITFSINMSFEEITLIQSVYGIIGTLILFMLMQIKKNGSGICRDLYRILLFSCSIVVSRLWCYRTQRHKVMFTAKITAEMRHAK